MGLTFSGRATLVVLPCSAGKASGGSDDDGGQHIVDDLPSELAKELVAARNANAFDAHVRGPTMPALRRYIGGLYVPAQPAPAACSPTAPMS
jgi:hypothetical protein